MGKLVVFEGTDGSGKSTQFRALLKWLEQKRKEFHRLQFPRYDNSSSALVRMYLNGEFGNSPDSVNPYAASTFYAVDRYASYIQDWRDYYQSGGLILSDRYTTSNAVHQGAKVPLSELQHFLCWLADLEYNKMQLPEPDVVILLDMPTELSVQLLQNRVESGGPKRDIHETDTAYLKHCRETALTAADYYGWIVVPCAIDGQIRGPESIAADIRDIFSERVF